MIARTIVRADFLAGLFVLLLGAGAVWEATNYPFGTLRDIGSGFFPVVLGALAIALGVGILGEGVAARRAGQAADESPAEHVSFRSLAAILGSLLSFVLLIDRAGLAPAIFAAVLIASLAERSFRPVGAVLLAIGLVGLCAAIFVYGLSLPFRIFAW